MYNGLVLHPLCGDGVAIVLFAILSRRTAFPIHIELKLIDMGLPALPWRTRHGRSTATIGHFHLTREKGFHRIPARKTLRQQGGLFSSEDTPAEKYLDALFKRIDECLKKKMTHADGFDVRNIIQAQNR